MSRKILFMVVVMSLASIASAAPVLVEEFSYATGTLTTQSGAVWAAHSGAGTNAIQVATGSIAYAGLTTSGEKATFGFTSGEDVNRGTFSITGSGAGETAYCSLVVNIATAQATGDYFFHMVDGVIGGNLFRGRIFARSSGGGYNLGIRLSSGDAIQWDATVRTFNVPVFLVEKLTSVSGATNDTASLFINPALDSTEPAPDLTATASAAADDWANLDLVAIRQGTAANTATGAVDSIRVATNWADATGSVVPVELSLFTIE